LLDLSLGKAGEIVAEKYLVAQKFNIVECNYRCPLGEIDLVARQREVLYFIEVKTRTSLIFGQPAEAVTSKKQHKLHQLALYYTATHKYSGPVAFGVVEVLYNQWQRHYQVNFIPHAF